MKAKNNPLINRVNITIPAISSPGLSLDIINNKRKPNITPKTKPPIEPLFLMINQYTIAKMPAKINPTNGSPSP